MMKRTVFFGTIFLITLSCAGQTAQQKIKTANDVLQRVIGKTAAGKIKLEITAENNDNDSYSYEAANGKLQVKATSVNALTKGVYDYIRANHMGMLDWAGNNFQIPARLPDAASTTRTSPFKIRHAYNVVTFGYTTPYWPWNRWEQELDWQVMHGFNMLMAPVATEAIATRVWKRLGLTQAEIDSFYVSPSLLPWQRMGNIQNVGGTLPPQWNEDQIALQHRLLARMRELGIKPVIQSFAGFVPKALKRIYPNLVLQPTLWNAGFPEYQRPGMLMPGDPLFAKITKMFVEEWEKEFGEATYFLVDSFNEMELPKTNEPVTKLLADYGKQTYDAIKAAEPKAIWVIQGWMFGYQSDQWRPENVKALFSHIPDNDILILDYANDYGNTWETLDAFNGKQWVYGFLPNAGGKTAYTGRIKLYAKGPANTLSDPRKKNLVGITISSEGFENNAVLYELLTDAAWSDAPVDLKKWLAEYSINRYGACPPEMMDSWDLLCKSAYKELIPHPQFNWQVGGFGNGTVNRDPDFYKSVQLFLSCREQLKQSKNYKADAVERAGLLLGLKAQSWFTAADNAFQAKDTAAAMHCMTKGTDLLQDLDKLMESHPLNRLERWVNFASQHTNDPALKHFYESDARRIITVWGPPVNDYACRVWSGLIRDFYIPRMKAIAEARKSGVNLDRNTWELAWVNNSTLSKVTPYADPVEAANALVEAAMKEEPPVIKK